MFFAVFEGLLFGLFRFAFKRFGVLALFDTAFLFSIVILLLLFCQAYNCLLMAIARKTSYNMVYRSRLIIPCKKHFKRTDRRVIGFRGLIQLKISFIILSDKPKIYAFFAFLNDSNAQERKENHVLANCSNHYYFCRSK